jgi:hypothetical protein
MPIFFYIILPLDLVTSVGLLTVPCFRGYPRLSGGSSRHERGDLSVKAKSVEYVRISSLYGAGFFYIPGTDTCIKLGGYLRVDTTFNGGIYDGPAWRRWYAQPLLGLLRRRFSYGADG